MKNLYRFLFCLALVLSSSYSAHSQSLKDRFFLGSGKSYLDFMYGPMKLSPDSVKRELRSGFALIAYSVNTRLNVIEFGSNKSLSANLNPTLGIGPSTFVSVPFTLNFNTGNVSTYSTDKDKGFTIGGGIEYNYLLFSLFDLAGGDAYIGKKGFLQPVFNIGYRYWNKNNQAKEVNLKLGYGSSSTMAYKDSMSKELEKITTPTLSFRLSFIRYINY